MTQQDITLKLAKEAFIWHTRFKELATFVLEGNLGEAHEYLQQINYIEELRNEEFKNNVVYLRR